MKKILLTLTLLIFGITSNGQTINNIPISELDVEYIEIVGTSKTFSNQLTIQLDFGQKTKFFSSNTKETVVNDENGKPIVFNSMIDALNFLTKYNFEFVTAYAITVNNQNVYHHLLRRKNK